mmetsp:Transcript_34132/g.78793  ORF Transcript_34132/g.78793 Transcript_34132/m.78793 type:complete len:261 (-) Transcript_34132:452-1234(-)
MMRVVEARATLRALEEEVENFETEDENGNSGDGDEGSAADSEMRRAEAMEILRNNGATGGPYDGPRLRMYFPDEGSAALARRDWIGQGAVPKCVEMSSLGGMGSAGADISKDVAIIFFCTKASEADFLENVLSKMEAREDDIYKLSVFINPNLVDMGVTGFGMAGRLLRERLLDGLPNVYYLRTLQWGALTRSWPKDFSVWQEDEISDGGYRLIKALNTLPTNPEVEDIYDIENGLQDAPKDGFGLLNAIGDFAQGLMRM